MELGAIFMLLTVIVLTGFFISRPLFKNPIPNRPGAGGSTKIDNQRSHLLAEYDRLLNALQELEFDHLLGKIPAEEYPIQRTQLLAGGSSVLRQLDALKEGAGNADDLAAEERIEAAVAARLARKHSARAVVGKKGSAVQTALEPVTASTSLPEAPAVEMDDEAMEAAIAARRQARKEKTGGFCPRCGKPVVVSDRFCPRCGNALTPSN